MQEQMLERSAPTKVEVEAVKQTFRQVIALTIVKERQARGTYGLKRDTPFCNETEKALQSVEDYFKRGGWRP